MSLLRGPKSISPEALRNLLASPPPETFFVDVRTPVEWNAGHIDGFRNIPLDELPARLDEFDRAQTVYFLCRSGGRSARACEIVEQTGRPGAVNVAGGILAWMKAGFPLTR